MFESWVFLTPLQVAGNHRLSHLGEEGSGADAHIEVGGGIDCGEVEGDVLGFDFRLFIQNVFVVRARQHTELEFGSPCARVHFARRLGGGDVVVQVTAGHLYLDGILLEKLSLGSQRFEFLAHSFEGSLELRV